MFFQLNTWTVTNEGQLFCAFASYGFNFVYICFSISVALIDKQIQAIILISNK